MTSTQGDSFEKLYLAERQKSKIFLGSTVLVTILLLITGYLYLQKPTNTTSTAPATQNGMSNFPGGGSFNGPSGLMGTEIKGFFKNDGSVDENKVSQLTENVPSEFKDRLLDRFDQQIDEAVSNSEITSDQGSALKKSMGIKTDAI